MSDSSTTAKLDNGSQGGEAPTELTAVVDELLNQLTTKFSTVSSDILSKMDEMSRRLDNLEATIQANQVQQPSEEPPK